MLVGCSVSDLNGMLRTIVESLVADDGLGGHGMGGMVMTSSTADRVHSPFEVAALADGQSLVGQNSC